MSYAVAKTETCKECGVTFDITQEEKAWYEEKGWDLPKRCVKCRKARRGVKAQKGARHE